MKRLLMLCLVMVGTVQAAEEKVHIAGPDGITLDGLLYVPAGAGPFPAIVLMHGCSGMWTAKGKPNATYDDWAKAFQSRGYIALLLDSFGPRGEKEICTQKDRRVSESRDRPRDAHAALGWFSERPDVKREQIYVMGWSNGGSSVLHALRAGTASADMPGRFRAAVAFYPGCRNKLLSPYVATAPLLIQAGAADNWTPARHCESLVREGSRAGAKVEIDVYPNAHHAFDRLGDGLRERADVRNASNPTGWGATVGAEPNARLKSRERTFAFLASQR